MIEERMKSAMQNKLPDVPEGFDARSDMQLLELTAPVKEKRMKLSIGWVTALVLVCVLATGAVAATLNIFGLRDVFFRYAEETGATLSENIEASIREDGTTVTTENAVYTVDETYYDEFYVRLTVTIRPEEKVLPISSLSMGESAADDDLWNYYSQFESEETLGDFVRNNYGGRVARMEAFLNPAADEEPEWEGEPDMGSEFRLNGDGSVTVQYNWETGEYLEQKAERKALLNLHYIPARPIEDDEDYFCFDDEKQETVQIPLTLYFSGNEKLACEDELDFPEAGVKVKKIVMTVTALDINCQLDYVITDPERFAAAQPEETLLAFRFVSPDENAADSGKVYPEGFNSSFVTHSSENDPDYHHSVFSVSRDALGDHYTIQAFNRMLDQTFGTAEFRVQPLETAE